MEPFNRGFPKPLNIYPRLWRRPRSRKPCGASVVERLGAMLAVSRSKISRGSIRSTRSDLAARENAISTVAHIFTAAGCRNEVQVTVTPNSTELRFLLSKHWCGRNGLERAETCSVPFSSAPSRRRQNLARGLRYSWHRHQPLGRAEGRGSRQKGWLAWRSDTARRWRWPASRGASSRPPSREKNLLNSPTARPRNVIIRVHPRRPRRTVRHAARSRRRTHARRALCENTNSALGHQWFLPLIPNAEDFPQVSSTSCFLLHGFPGSAGVCVELTVRALTCR